MYHLKQKRKFEISWPGIEKQVLYIVEGSLKSLVLLIRNFSLRLAKRHIAYSMDSIEAWQSVFNSKQRL